MKICVHTKTYIGVSVADLFMIDKTWKHLRCSLIGKDLNYSTYTTLNLLSDQKGANYMIYITWVNPQKIMCMEKAKSVNYTLYDSIYITGLELKTYGFLMVGLCHISFLIPLFSTCLHR